MKIETKTCVKIGVGAFLLYLCIYYWGNVSGMISTLISAEFPLLIGCVIAYPLNILMSFYERHWFPNSSKAAVCKSRRAVCIVLAILTLLAIVALIVCIVVPQLVSCVSLLFAEVPNAVKQLVSTLQEFDIIPKDWVSKLASIDWQSKIGDIAKVLTSGIGSVMDIAVTAVSTVVSGVTSFFLAVIFAIYLMFGKDKLKNQCDRIMKRYMRQSWYDKCMYGLSVINDCFHRYIVGQCTEAVILGLLCMVGMLILRLPYAAMMGAVIAFTALIPIVGAFIGGAIGVFLIMMESPVKALIFLIFLIVLQQIEGNLIYPRVVGSSLGLPAIWVLTAVTLGGGVFGIPGMIISVPLAAAAYRLLRNDLNKPCGKHIKKAKTTDNS